VHIWWKRYGRHGQNCRIVPLKGKEAVYENSDVISPRDNSCFFRAREANLQAYLIAPKLPGLGSAKGCVGGGATLEIFRHRGRQNMTSDNPTEFEVDFCGRRSLTDFVKLCVYCLGAIEEMRSNVCP
jgi:hypothetical protein